MFPILKCFGWTAQQAKKDLAKQHYIAPTYSPFMQAVYTVKRAIFFETIAYSVGDFSHAKVTLLKMVGRTAGHPWVKQCFTRQAVQNSSIMRSGIVISKHHRERGNFLTRKSPNFQNFVLRSYRKARPDSPSCSCCIPGAVRFEFVSALLIRNCPRR